MDGHVIVCGFSAIGMRVVEQLVESGERVVLVVRSVDRALESALRRWDIEHHTAAIGVESALVDAGIATAQSVLCVEDDELWNLETALVAGSLRPDVRVVTQMANATVRGALSDGATPGTTLDIADLAAPSVIETCLGNPLYDIEIDGTRFATAALRVPRASTLRELYGDLAPIAVTTSTDDDGPHIHACPGRDLAVHPGDVATMFGTPEQLAAHQASFESAGPAAVVPSTVRPGPMRRVRIAAPGAKRAGPIGAVRAFVEDANPNFFRMLGVLLCLLTLSTLILRLGYRKPGMSVLDAIYFSTETVATVGYGDFNFATQPTWLRIWSILLMFAGLTTTAMIMAFLAELLVSRRLSQSMGRRRAQHMSGHVVVIGLGAFGIRVARELVARGGEVVIVEVSDHDRYLSAAAALNIPIVFGDATLPETLLDAGVDRAASVAVLTSNDMVNVEIGITVRGILGEKWHDTPERHGVPVVMRVFDRTLAVAVTERFGFRNVRSTAELAAPWFIGAALGIEVLGTLSVRSRSFMIGQLPIRAGGGLEGVAMQGLSAHTRVVAIKRSDGTLEYPPRRGTSFAAGDRAYLMGPYEELLSVLEQQRRRRPA